MVGEGEPQGRAQPTLAPRAPGTGQAAACACGANQSRVSDRGLGTSLDNGKDITLPHVEITYNWRESV